MSDCRANYSHASPTDDGCWKKPAQGCLADNVSATARKPHSFIALAIIAAALLPRRTRAHVSFGKYDSIFLVAGSGAKFGGWKPGLKLLGMKVSREGFCRATKLSGEGTHAVLVWTWELSTIVVDKHRLVLPGSLKHELTTPWGMKHGVEINTSNLVSGAQANF